MPSRFFFFFQAEDGIRVIGVTGVQTCALPIFERRAIAGDRRSYAMHLTPEGRRLAEAGIAAQRDFVASTLGKLGSDDLAELDRLVLLWRDLARAVDAE